VTGLRCDQLPTSAVREALALLGHRDVPATRSAALRALREELRSYGVVRGLVDRAPGSAGDAFARLAHDGPAAVEALLQRGWWGHGTLPPPLDWLQRRALVQVGDDGLVHVTVEAREGFLDQALWAPGEAPNAAAWPGGPGGDAAAAEAGGPGGGGAAADADWPTARRPGAGRSEASSAPVQSDPAAPPAPGGPDAPAPVHHLGDPDYPGDPALRVEAAGCVVVAPDAAALDRAVAVTAADLRAVAPTVAVSPRRAGAVTAVLRAAGVPLLADEVVPAASGAPALPGTPERAVGPKAVRELLERAVEEQRQLRLEYYASSRGGAATDRVVDPWSFDDDLLVGYCHLREGERTFAVDRVGRALLLPSPVEIPPGRPPR
jgi:hypothetical protein